MSQRIRAPLVALGVVVLAGLAVWFVVLRPGPAETDPVEDPRLVAQDPDGPGIPGSPRDPSLAPGAARPGQPGTARGGPSGLSPSGLPARTIEGVDLSDPQVVQDLLRKALTDERIDWRRVAQLVAVFEGRLDDEIRQALMKQLATGDRVGALRAFSLARDGTLATDLLRMLDEQNLTRKARESVVLALGALPGANDAEVVLGLEGRLTGDRRNDLPILKAIGRRGGPEAARAIVAYVLESDNPTTLPHQGYLQLDLTGDADAAAIVAAAIGRTSDPEHLRALIRLASQPGADAMVESLIALDREDVPAEVRQEALEALGRIGTDPAVTRLLEVAAQPGAFGEAAIGYVGRIRSATKEARARLVAALDDAALQTNPRARLELLRALGSIGEPTAVEPMVKALQDPDVQIQVVAIRGLGNMGEAAQPHVDDLVTLFSTGTETMQQQIAIALGGIGGAEARDVLRQMLTSDTLTPATIRNVKLALQRMQQDEEEAESTARLGG